ncbi:MAG: hypothetical protein PUH54_09750 [Oscillospiraceae bacterium]|nr:hypothetical protein [Oscillospiraceae bacterium]
MACFIVPATEAVITTVATKILKKKGSESSIRFAGKLDKLNGLLWGGSGLLAFEHLWHGEITPFFPFLTSAADTESTQRMLYEMSTSGVAMAAVVTAVWAVSVILENIIKKKSAEPVLQEEKQ